MKLKFLLSILLISHIASSQPCFFTKQLGGTNREYVNGISVDGAGNIYTTGTFKFTADFDPGTGTYNLISNGAATDIFISKLDASGNFIWAKQIGGTGNDYVYSIFTDAAGNVYTTGIFVGTADFDPGAGTYNLTSIGFSAIFVSKLDSSGNFIWAKQIGGGSTSASCAYSIAADGAGNVYTTGSFLGTVDFDPSAVTYNLTSINNNDIFISKLNASGNFVWAKRMGAVGWEIGQSIFIDGTGNVYTTGPFEGTVDFDPNGATYNLTSTGDKDIFVSKLDASGNFIWAKAMGGTGEDQGQFISVDGTGNIYITGYFENTADFDPGSGTLNLTSVGYRDIFISKLDASSGNLTWAKAMGGAGQDEGASISVDGAGNVYTTGSFYDTLDFNPGAGIYNLTSAGLSDIFVHELDALGNFLQAINMGGTSWDYGNSISVQGGGAIFLTGSFENTADFDPSAGTYTFTAGTSDVFVSKIHLLSIKASAINNVSCHGENNGSASITINEGTSPYTYIWNTIPVQTTATVSGLMAGVYSVTITDGCGGTSVDTVNIIQPTVLTTSFSIISPTCSNNNGSVISAAGGGTAPYTYSWNSGNTTAAVTGLSGSSTQTLIVTITDANNCTLKDSTIVQCATGIQTYDSQNKLSITPNPLSTLATLQTIKFLKDATLTIYNLYGQPVKQIENIFEQTIIFHRDNLPSGLYFVQLTQDGKIFSVDKLVITDN